MSTAHNSPRLKRVVSVKSNVWKWWVSKNVGRDKCPHKHLWMEKLRHKHVTRSCRSCWCTDSCVKFFNMLLLTCQSSSKSNLNLNILKAVQGHLWVGGDYGSLLHNSIFPSKGRRPYSGPTSTWENVAECCGFPSPCKITNSAKFIFHSMLNAGS